MLTIINTIKNALLIGMDFDVVLDIVKTYTDTADVTAPDADTFGYIIIGDPYGFSLTLDFDDADRLSAMDFDDGDWD